MNPEWIAVDGSSRIIAEAYDENSGTIFVRFPDAVEWWYGGCSLSVWEAFTAPGQSKGTFIKEVLDGKPNGRWSG
jgi:hypothetical protein